MVSSFTRKFIVFIFFYVFTLPILVFAKPTLSISVEPQSGSLDDIYEMELYIEGAGSSDYPVLENNEDFKISLIGPERRIQIINGVSTSSITYRYRLVAKREGLLKTPTITVNVGDQMLSAEGSVVVVSPSKAASDTTSTEPIFLRQKLSTDTAYEGEQIIHSLTLYTRVPIRSANLQDKTFTDFWAEEIGGTHQGTTRISGYEYSTNVIRNALFPLTVGTVTLPNRSVSAEVRINNSHSSRTFPFALDDQFSNMFFGNQYKQQIINSNELKLSVLPLPPSPPVNDWGLSSPIVGTSTIFIDYNDAPMKVGESRTITVRVKSYGNLNPLTKIPIKQNADYKIYEDTPKSTKSDRGGYIESEKSFSFSLVPKFGGNIEFGPLKLPYFSPEDKTYKEAISNTVHIEIEGKKRNIAKKTQIAESSSKVADIPKYIEEPPIYSNSILVFVAVAIFIIILIFMINRKKSESKKQSMALLSKIDTTTSLNEIFPLLIKIINKIGVPISNETTIDEARSIVSLSSLDKAAILEIKSLLDSIELHLYGGRPSTPHDLEQLKSRIKNILGSLSI